MENWLIHLEVYLQVNKKLEIFFKKQLIWQNKNNELKFIIK